MWKIMMDVVVKEFGYYSKWKTNANIMEKILNYVMRNTQNENGVMSVCLEKENVEEVVVVRLMMLKIV
jgi:hypothetical protein